MECNVEKIGSTNPDIAGVGVCSEHYNPLTSADKQTDPRSFRYASRILSYPLDRGVLSGSGSALGAAPELVVRRTQLR